MDVQRFSTSTPPHQPTIPLRLRDELRRFLHAARALDRQAVVVIVLAAALSILQYHLGDRDLYARMSRAWGGRVDPIWNGLFGWGWWFFVQGILGFVIPVAVLTLGFKRRPAEIGLGRGDLRLAGWIALLYLPLVTLGTWVLSSQPAFQANYPHYFPASRSWAMFAVYELLFLFYWMGWEYLWRGFVLFGTHRALGAWAVLVQMLPFAAYHADKPLPEALLSIVGGIALGALCLRARSFWIAVPIHSVQMLLLDFFCSIRGRTGVNGLSPAALVEIIGKL